MLALRKQIAKDFQKLLILYLGLLSIFATSFYRDPLFGTLWSATKLYAFFVVPSYMLYATNNPGNFEKEILAYVGIYLGAALIISYYVAIAGLNIAYHAIILPLVFLIYALIRAGKAGSLALDSNA